MPSRSILQTITARLHTVNPAVVVVPIAIAGWLAPGLAIGDATTPTPAEQATQQLNKAIELVRGIGGSNAPATATTPGSPQSPGVTIMAAPAPALSPTIVGGSGMSGGNSGGPSSTGARGASAHATAPPQTQFQAPPRQTPALGSPPPVRPQQFAAVPRATPIPVAPHPPPVVMASPPPPAIVVIRPPLRPFGLLRPAPVRPFGGGFVRRR
jgi:hypothetical protein